MLDLLRLFQISWAIGGYLVWLLLRHWHVWPSAVSPGRKASMILQRLGTAFIKFGQGLSLRRDLLPDDFVSALQELQDRVTPFPAALAEREIETALGKPLDHLFSEFEREPMAAASIAQVHRARLPDGTAVIVKVRRPGIKAQVSRDMRLLRHVLRVVQVLAPGLRRFRPLDLVREIEINLLKEIDLRSEARNIARFAAAFAAWPGVHVPPAIAGLSAESILVQVLSGGRRVDDPSLQAEGLQRRLAETFVDAYLHQFFVLGLFHADPHPGNLFIRADGSICFHDFGLVGFLDRDARRNLAGFMQAFIHQDGAWLLDAYLDLGVLGGAIDRSEFQHGLEELLLDYGSLPLKDWSFGEAFLRIARLGRGQNIRLPQHLLLLMRTFFIMESTVRSLDPEFNLQERLAHKAQETPHALTQGDGLKTAGARLKYETAMSLQEVPAGLAILARKLRTGDLQLPLRHSGFEDWQQHVDRGANRVALALVSLGLYIAASLLMQHAAGPRLGNIPLLAIFGYGLALWFTLLLAAGILRSGRL